MNVYSYIFFWQFYYFSYWFRPVICFELILFFFFCEWCELQIKLYCCMWCPVALGLLNWKDDCFSVGFSWCPYWNAAINVRSYFWTVSHISLISMFLRKHHYSCAVGFEIRIFFFILFWLFWVSCIPMWILVSADMFLQKRKRLLNFWKGFYLICRSFWGVLSP